MRIPAPHYAWIVAGTCTLVVLSAVGLARFAFGIILPLMAADLRLGYNEQGILGASYFLGYLAMVALMPWVSSRLSARRLCVGGLLVIAPGLLVMALSRDYPVLSASYFAVGIGSGAAFVGAMTLPAFWFQPSHRARGAGLVTAGAGLGILSSGLLVPRVPAAMGLAQWQLVWLGFAIAALAIALIAAVVLRDRPEEIGLAPFGQAKPKHASLSRSGGHAAGKVWPILLHLGAIYALFAATALTYTTFIVTTMVNEFAVPKVTAGLLWAAVGGLSMVSGTLFGHISDRFGDHVGMALTMAIQSAAFGLAAVGLGAPGLYASTVLFGISAWSMPSIMAAASGRYLGAERAASGFAVLTLMFAGGQVLGPAGAGMLAEWTGSFAASYGVAACLALLAVLLSLLLAPGKPRPVRHTPR
ncbi:MAG: YbfB/YjiJ family MFS transporter [Alphaproteobacteria bacterium]|nr:YbfB/YjiJ family MFS transporter [Alphaproteobacteria bacterium]